MTTWCSGPPSAADKHALGICSFRRSSSTWRPSSISFSSTINTRMLPCRSADTHTAYHLNDMVSPSRLVFQSLHSIFRDFYGGAIFLLEQHQELKHLEFPSLQSASTMALFTIAMVMVLIIILATIDSGLGYFMSRIFSRVA